MKFNKLKAISAILIIASVPGFGAAQAALTQDPNIDNNNVLELKGKTESGDTAVTLEVYETEKKPQNTDLNNIGDTFYYLGESISDNNGNYEFKIPIKGGERTLNLRIKEGKDTVIEKTVDFKNNIAADYLKKVREAKTTDEMRTALNDFLTAVSFDFDLYINNKDAINESDLVYNIVLNARTTDANSQDDLTKISKYATVIYAIANANDADEIENIIKNYSDVIFTYDKGVGDLFKNENCVNDSIRKDIINKVYDAKINKKSVFGSKDNFRNFMKDTVVLTVCEKNRGYKIFGDIMEAFSDIYSTSFSDTYKKYNGLTESKKNEAALNVVGQKFSTLLSMKDAIANAIDTVSKQSGSSSSGSSSGGSSSSGSAISFGNVTDIITNKKISVKVPPKSGSIIGFSDIDAVDWARESILDLSQRGVISGKSEENFAPFDSVTREEFIKMIVAAIGLETSGKNCSFDDVKSDAWCYPYVAAGYTAGIMLGTDSNNFGVGNTISRQDIAAVVGRALKKAGVWQDVQSAEKFADDGAISDYAREWVYGLKQLGIINGKDGNNFDPRGNATRAEAAKIIKSVIDCVE